jgi:hypothetical protein
MQCGNYLPNRNKQKTNEILAERPTQLAKILAIKPS